MLPNVEESADNHSATHSRKTTKHSTEGRISATSHAEARPDPESNSEGTKHKSVGSLSPFHSHDHF